MIDPHKIQKDVELAFITEAIIPKSGCSSRYKDLSKEKSLLNFTKSALDSGKYFYELGNRINKSHCLEFYDLPYECMKNNSGKIINYGLLETMFPAVVARNAYSKKSKDAFKNLAAVLKNTTKKDVYFVSKMRELIYKKSNKKFKNEYPFHSYGKNVLEHYKIHMEHAGYISKEFVKEIISGMPISKYFYERIQKSKNISQTITETFDEVRKKTILVPGAIADFAAVSLYMYFSEIK